jgi:membrane fusion protein (multidrug efflux system)
MAESNSTENQATNAPETAKVVNPRQRAITYVIVGVAAIAAVVWLTRTISFAYTHQTTDDAYVTGNTVNVSPLISGTLSQLLVNEGDTVKRGQLIARLDDSQVQAALHQAQAAYDAAKSALPEAETTVKFQEETAKAALEKAQAGLQAQKARTAGSGDLIKLSKETTFNQIAQARAQANSTMALAAEADAQVNDREASAKVAQAGVVSAQKGVLALRAKLGGARSDVSRTQADLERYSTLLKQEAVTQQQYDSVASQAANAASALNSLQQQIAQAESQVTQAQATASQAQTAVIVARRAAAAAHSQVEVAKAGIKLAEAGRPQIAVNERNFNSSIQTEAGNTADIASAQAGMTQVDVYKQRVATTRAQVAQAKAVLDNAKVQLGYTYIYAPADGQVVRKAVNVGASVASGQTLVVIAQNDAIWVTGNFKETQLGSMRVGQTAEVEIDALPGVKFEAVVASINETTGAATSLLPPDNATGNFTKVVQRIPVRIAFLPPKDDAAAQNLKLVRQGMSVVAVVDITDKTPHPDRVPSKYDGDPTIPFVPSQAPNGGQDASKPATAATN